MGIARVCRLGGGSTCCDKALLDGHCLYVGSSAILPRTDPLSWETKLRADSGLRAQLRLQRECQAQLPATSCSCWTGNRDRLPFSEARLSLQSTSPSRKLLGWMAPAEKSLLLTNPWPLLWSEIPAVAWEEKTPLSTGTNLRNFPTFSQSQGTVDKGCFLPDSQFISFWDTCNFLLWALFCFVLFA